MMELTWMVMKFLIAIPMMVMRTQELNKVKSGLPTRGLSALSYRKQAELELFSLQSWVCPLWELPALDTYISGENAGEEDTRTK